MIGQTPQPRQKKKTFLLTVTPIDQHLKNNPTTIITNSNSGWMWIPLPSVEEVVWAHQGAKVAGLHWEEWKIFLHPFDSMELCRYCDLQIREMFFFLSFVLLQCIWSLVSRIYSRVFFVKLEHGFFLSFFLSGKILHPGFKIFDRPTFKILQRDQIRFCRKGKPLNLSFMVYQFNKSFFGKELLFSNA